MPERLSSAFEEKVAAVSLNNRQPVDGDDWELSLTTLGEPDIDDIFATIEDVESGIINKENISAEILPELDWLQEVHKNFPPVTIGRFFIYGSHYEGEIPQGLTGLKIDAATAFGSGEHETTKGCILALEYLHEQGYNFSNALDMGCGSGILAIAAAKLWHNIVFAAVDIDPESVVVTNRHAYLNGVDDRIHTEAGNGYYAPIVDKCAPYDLVTSNILSGPLVEMAPQLAAVLKSGGFVILSGLLTRQKEDVVAAHAAFGLKLIEAKEIGEWQALIMQKN